MLQGGEDPYFTDDIICDIVSSIKERYPDCAVTLSIGEKSRESYKAYFDAGADRFLLRHETADESHYNRLHPASMSLKNRKRCLYDLKEIGYQVGAGFMVGSPYQTAENIADDILFLAELRPHMVGIGPFIPHDDTPFRDFKAGSLELTCTRAQPDAADAALRFASLDDRARNDSAKRQGARYFERRQRRDAELVSRGGKRFLLSI